MTRINVTDFIKNNLPKNVEHMYSEIWFPDLLDSEKCESSLLSIRLNCKQKKHKINKRIYITNITAKISNFGDSVEMVY